MAIAVTPTYYDPDPDIRGTFVGFAKLAITGLTAASGNTVPHGLPRPPRAVLLVPGAAGLWGETQAADGTNIYITVGSGGATAGTAYALY